MNISKEEYEKLTKYAIRGIVETWQSNYYGLLEKDEANQLCYEITAIEKREGGIRP